MSSPLKALSAIAGTLALAFGLIWLPSPAPAQRQVHNPNQLYSYTVANRPTSVASGLMVYVTDCESSSACATGGGTNKLINVYNGASWDVAGGGGGATSCAGDLTGTYPNCVVAKVNSLAVPASAGLVATNSSRQFTAVTTPLSLALGGTGRTNGPINTIYASVITGSIGAAGDDFIAFGSNTVSATLAQRAWVMANGCTAENVTVGTTNAQSGTGSLVFTLWDLGTNPASLSTGSGFVVDTVTIAATGGAGTWTGTGSTRVIASNTYMSLEVKNNASVASANFITWGFQCI